MISMGIIRSNNLTQRIAIHFLLRQNLPDITTRYLLMCVICEHVYACTARLYICILNFQDCGTPSKTGYAYSGTTGNTYGETSSVSCAVGYEGTVSPSTVTCDAAGTWTDVTGCSIKGKAVVYQSVACIT